MMTYELDDTEKRALLESVLERARADMNDGRPLTEMKHQPDARDIAVEILEWLNFDTTLDAVAADIYGVQAIISKYLPR